MIKQKLGNILIESGLITKDQLENALLIQREQRKKLGKILIALGYVSETQIAKALSDQLSLPMVNCEELALTKELMLLIPKETAEKKTIYPIEANEKTLMIAMSDPLDWQTLEDLSFATGLRTMVAVSSGSNIKRAIELNYGDYEETWDVLREIPLYDDVEFVQNESYDDIYTISYQVLFNKSIAPPIVRLVTMIIADAVNCKASDIHIEPRYNNVQVRYRIDGELKNIFTYPNKIHASIVSRVKIISNLDITNRRYSQDGRSSIKLKEKNVDLRVSTLPALYGEKIVIRLLDPITGLMSLNNLGISEHIIRPLVDTFSQPQGMVLVTGPTGCGKTTTLYSIIQELMSEKKNIITIEDPIEYKLKSITQVGINEDLGVSFANTLRSVLRQDPDIIFVGEIRDHDTAEIAARASLTGHLVFSTVHTNDSLSTVTRLRDLGLQSYLITSSVTGILSQRLLRKICPDCKIEIDPPAEVVSLNIPRLTSYYKGLGCGKCNQSGYRGRTGVFELLQIDDNIKRLISGQFSEQKLWNYAKKSEFKTLFDDALTKVRDGITTFDEVITKIPDLYRLARRRQLVGLTENN